MPIDVLVDIFRYLYELLIPLSRTIAAISVLVGAGLWAFGGTNTARALRGRGMFVGGAVALVTIFAVTTIYQVLVFIILGSGGGSPGAGYVFPPAAGGSDTVAALRPLAAALSQATSILGTGLLAFGTALWGASQPNSKYRRRSRRVFWWGIGLILASFIGVLLAALNVLGLF
jgi:hypothetical protein